jgi:hypothetical protein
MQAVRRAGECEATSCSQSRYSKLADVLMRDARRSWLLDTTHAGVAVYCTEHQNDERR